MQYIWLLNYIIYPFPRRVMVLFESNSGIVSDLRWLAACHKDQNGESRLRNDIILGISSYDIHKTRLCPNLHASIELESLSTSQFSITCPAVHSYIVPTHWLALRPTGLRLLLPCKIISVCYCDLTVGSWGLRYIYPLPSPHPSARTDYVNILHVFCQIEFLLNSRLCLYAIPLPETWKPSSL